MSYFINYEKKATEEKCPRCNEEFLGWKGGAQCPASCLDKQTEEKHRLVAQLMVNHCLAPNYWAAVNCPSDWPLTSLNYDDIDWGWTDDIGKRITFPIIISILK